MTQQKSDTIQSAKKPSRLAVLCAASIVLVVSCLLIINMMPKSQTHLIHSKTIQIPEPIEETVIAAAELKAKATEHNLASQLVSLQISNPQILKNALKTQPTSLIAPKSAPKIVKKDTWQTVRPRTGDSMAAIFKRLGLSAQNLHEVLKNAPDKKMLTAINPTQKLQFLINKHHLDKLVIPVNFIQTLTISRVGTAYKVQLTSKKTTPRNIYVSATIKGSLSNTAQRAAIPYKYISKMTEILKRDINVAHTQQGDRFSIVYEGRFIDNKMVSTGDIQAVSYTSHNKTVQAIKHISRDGTVDYYSPQGNSFKKAFNRYPIKFSHISSTFALSRYHPILHYRRAHKGIDLAAPIGTPIQTIGDGVVTEINRHNGYGNMIKIKHDKTYSTIYAHMLKFQRGLSKGSRVKKGQVIGYVGQTGLASGPHCHFELHVNNQPRNPTTTNIPTAASVPKRELAAFKIKASTLLAQLNSSKKTTIANKNNRAKPVG